MTRAQFSLIALLLWGNLILTYLQSDKAEPIGLIVFSVGMLLSTGGLIVEALYKRVNDFRGIGEKDD